MFGLRELIAGGVRNPVLVNLLMVCMLAGGLAASRRMVRETFPEFSLDHVGIEVAYPGASTVDVERTICTPIEKALRGMRGVREVSSSANENFGAVWVALVEGAMSMESAINEVKTRVDQITTLPPEAHKPVITEKVLRAPVINIAIYGDVSERTLKRIAQEVELDLTAHPDISQVSLSGVRDDEILIEVSRPALSAHHLSVTDVMAVIAKSSLDLPAGVIRTAEEELTLRVTGQRFRAMDYEDLIVQEHEDAVVRLGDIATVREGFEEVIATGSFNGKRAVVVAVFKTPDQDTTRIAAIVRAYVAAHQGKLPEKLKMSVWSDGSHDVDQRISMLVCNGVLGVLLVLVVLTLFLEFRLALWVTVGIPVSFAGALIVMYAAGQSINMISLFALIMVSGIIVDDAIVIAESIHTRRRAGLAPEQACIQGASRVALPVLGASLTTIAAFVPLLYVSGVMGRFIYVLPVVVIGAVVASAVEAFGILPSHLCRHVPPGITPHERPPTRWRRAIDKAVARVITAWYRPVCRLATRCRVVTISAALMVLLVVIGMVAGGRVPIILLPIEDANVLRARVRFPEGTPASTTRRAVAQLEQAAWRLNDDDELRPATDGKLVRQIYATTGEFADFLPRRGSNLCEVKIELMPAKDRLIRFERIISRWRAHVGEIYDAVEYSIRPQELGPVDRPIEVRLMAMDLDDLDEAADRVKTKLETFAGVTEVQVDLVPGKRELQVSLKPMARTLGLTLDDVARQLRYGYFGGEALRVYRGRDQVTVRVRYADNERESIAALEALRIKTHTGREIPFREVADVVRQRGYRNIMHQNGKRRVRIFAGLDHHVANAEQIVASLETEFLPDLVADYDDMIFAFGGDRKHIAESVQSLTVGFLLAMLAIYTILAAMLRSYVQPIVILVVVPFGLIGAVVGHALIGLDLTMMSLFGMVALSGVVVNDALVLIDAINRRLGEGESVNQAVAASGEERFKAVVLTSITTVAGLMPLLLERSGQAQSVMPMAVALSFGILAATVLTLIVVPTTFLLVNDLRRGVRWLRLGGSYPDAEVVEVACMERKRGLHDAPGE